MNVPQVAYWMGRPITELSKEELVEVVLRMARDLDEYRKPGMVAVYARGQVEMWKRGLATP